jgi:hypothetical protein
MSGSTPLSPTYPDHRASERSKAGVTDFKIGDRVRVLVEHSIYGSPNEPGELGRVTGLPGDGHTSPRSVWLCVLLDQTHGDQDGGGLGNYYQPEDLALEVEGEATDVVNHPPHYKQGGIETITVIEAWGLGFHLGNAVKYISRAGKKDPAKTVEDLSKAVWYVQREIDRLTSEAVCK